MSAIRPHASIVIKALNEERHIATAIESALAALEGIDGEAVLADSLSIDRTVAVAARYPVKIVRLNRIEDRSCGAAVQLGYQHSRGRYVCLIDGDMRLRAGFLPAAIRFLEDNPDFAGVGGLIAERETGNAEFVKRASDQDANLQPGEVSHLACGGVYRRAAIESVGYFGDRNLHSAEELELGIRLAARGWKLARIDVAAIDHFGHASNAYRLLVRRWTTHFAFGTGEILRAAFGNGCFRRALNALRRPLLLWTAVHVWWLALAQTLAFVHGFVAAATATAAIALSPFIVMSARCHSVRIGVYSVVAWNVYAAGLWPGLLQRRRDPADRIESTVIRDSNLSGGPRMPSRRAEARAALNSLVTG